MDLADVSNAIWQLEADSAMLATASLAATVDLAHPAMGLHNLAINGQRFESTNIFQLNPPGANAWEIEDCYCRGHDLIVTYAPSKEHPLRTQLIWRVGGADNPLGSGDSIELIVSVQTDSLGTDPQLCVESTITSIETLRYVESAGPTFALVGGDDDVANHPVSNGYLIRMSDAPDRIAHFVHPDDYRGGSLSSQQTPQGTNCRIAHPLFAGDLEKGVILRGRLAVFFFTSGDAMENAAVEDTAAEDPAIKNAIGAYRQFITQPLPLAT